MEVHHHPDMHRKTKKFKEYLLEFLMIFLTMTTGFFAESLRAFRCLNRKPMMTIRSTIKPLAKLVLGMVFFASSPTFAQLNAGDLTQYTELEGLPSTEIHNIVTDKLGYLWVGTINGLTRFDGYAFKRFYFNPNDTATFHGLNVSSLFEDHQGQLWAGSSPSYLNVYNPASGKFHQYRFAHLINHPAEMEIDISAICEDNQGRIYFGADTYHGETITGALLFKDEKDDSVKKFIAPDSMVIENIYRMTKDKAGNVFFLSRSGLFKIDSQGKVTKMHNASLEEEAKKNKEYATDIQFDKDGSAWIPTTMGRLCHFDPNFNSYTVFTPSDSHSRYFISIAFDKYDNIWIGTTNGLLKFNRQSGEFEGFSDESLKQSEKTIMTDLHFDGFGTLWIGTLKQGLFKYEERALFKSFSYHKEDKNSLTSGWANVIYETPDGKIWIGTSGAATSGLDELDLQTHTIRSFPFKSLKLESWEIHGMIENSPGELLFNDDKGNWLFSTKTGAIKKITLNGVTDNNNINQFYKDSKGNLFLCTQKGLIKKNKDAEFFKTYDLSILPGASSLSNEITKALESPKHGLWLATNNGLFLYNYATDQIERHGFDKKGGDFFLSQDVNSLYEDPGGILWVGTWQGGLSMYNAETKKIRTYTQDDGLPSMCIQGIIADEKNSTLWLSTFEGLCLMDLKTNQFFDFSIADGIQSQSFADGAYLKTAGGFLFSEAQTE